MDNTLSVIVSTYDWPVALDVVLGALSEQSDSGFEIVIADDGSGSATENVVKNWQNKLRERLVYVSQADEGYRLARVRNLGFLVSSGDYLVFLDGDCIPRRHFVRAMRSAARPGWFAAGRRISLSHSLTERALTGQEEIHRRSVLRWFMNPRDARGLPGLIPRDRRTIGRVTVPDFEPDSRGYGSGFGVLRDDFVSVNGYDTRFCGWGEEDVDIALRLRRLGLRCGHAGSDAVFLHLWHGSRMTRERRNWWLLKETEESERIRAVDGVAEAAGAAGLVTSRALTHTAPRSWNACYTSREPAS